MNAKGTSGMEQERFQRAERLFHQALELNPEGRDHYIAQAAGDDDELASRVHRMLQYAGQSTASAGLVAEIEAKPAREHDTSGLIGARLGPYRVVDVIGEGGFGVVYRAEQEYPVRRPVAMKILKSGMGSRQVIARFDAERQALAMMEHPGIARVFDAGQTEAALGSRPYFVMEFVTGAPITQYCDERTLTTSQRLELFMCVCRAVQHAHQRGIVHRDLKPSNILVADVDGKPAPKIIDFGIAKATQQPLTERTLVTEARQMLGTPQYMSPEQADSDGRDIDTRSDIYSLGVVLYELLTGMTPLEVPSLRIASYSQMQQMIREQPAERPSARLTRSGEASRSVAARQKTDVAALRRQLRGDLDWIVLKALEKDRERRYASASEFADDVRRHLEHQPVLAGPPSAAYRVRKFVRRHRMGVLAAAVVALALVGGAVGMTVGMMRARDAAQQAIAVNEFMREVLTSVDPDQMGADVPLVDVLEDASRTASQRFAGHPALEAQVRELLGSVYGNLSKMDQSLTEFQRALALRRQELGTDHPLALGIEIAIAKNLASRQRTDELEPLLKDLLPRIQRIFGQRHEHMAALERCAAQVHLYRGRVDEAEQQIRATLAWADAAFHPESDIRLSLVETLVQILLQRLEYLHLHPDGGENLLVLDEAYSLCKSLRDSRALRSGPQSIATLAVEAKLGDIAFRRGLFGEAIEWCQSILDRSVNVLSECHDIRESSINTLSYSLRAQGQVEAAAETYLRQIACMRNRVRDDDIVLLAVLTDGLPFMDHGRRWSEGEALARELQTKFQKFGDAHGSLTFGPDIYLARFCTLQGRLEEAAPIFERWLNNQALVTGSDRARLHLFYGGYLVRQERFEEAEGELLFARTIMGGLESTMLSHPDDIILEFIALYEAWGKAEKVQEYRCLREEIIR
ncbi:MAG: serine/threonine-protein kinase, partial [Phycisphaerales bacterium]|nr:serine/threonine-protein kinase [Phycisphaerales bacterium]